MQSQDISRIDLMSRVKRVADSQSSQDVELTETNAVSPDSMAREDGPSEVLPSQSAWKCYWKRCTFLVMLVICSAVLGFEINAQQGADVIVHEQSLTYPDDFNFLVFCPYSYYSKEASFREKSQPNDELRRRLLSKTYSYTLNVNPKDQANFDANRTFLVEAQSNSFQFINETTNKTDSRIELFYCGLVRDFYSTCEDSYMACSSPGPMFDIPARESVDIIWVNKLNPNNLPDVGDSCMNSSYVPLGKNWTSFCSLMAKINRTQTFIDPTGLMDISTPLQHMTISNDKWPITMHLHGAEIRPTFDGNPLSWIDNRPFKEGQVGVATFSLDEDCYYNSFDKISNSDNYNPPRIALIGDEIGKSNYKINRYPNRQNPGNLWYHDHAMHLTDYNVKYGLAGFYILRDEKVQAQIGVDRSNEKLVMITSLGFGDMKASFPLSGFIPGEVYRFRFLNNNFDDGTLSMIRISFSYQNCQDKLNNRESFTIIGADSSLFSQSIDGQKSFVITQAERMEILIIFQGKQSFSICANDFAEDVNTIGTSQQSFSVKSSGSHGGHQNSAQTRSYSIKGIGLSKRESDFVSLNTRTNINNISLNVPFTDLSKKTKIAVTRMRPLLWVGYTIFTINGRTDFHAGWSENPTVGTIEDWFIINTIYFPHPIHVHLINFQVIKEYDLRVVITPNANQDSPNCSLYQLDFYVETLKNVNSTQAKPFKDNIFTNLGIDYNYLCDNLQEIGSLPTVQEELSQIYPENKADSKGLSGHDLFKLVTRAERPSIEKLKLTIPINFTDPDSYKYIADDGHPSAKPYYARWKDTAFVEGYKALQYRIRWTKSDYTAEDEKKGTFFNVPNDQLREFPGYVYHCHILRHEDDEMMRPIMMQLPPNAQLNTSTPCNSYTDNRPILKWSDKYNCINKGCNNTKIVK